MVRQNYWERICELPTTTILFAEEPVDILWKNRFKLVPDHKRTKSIIAFRSLRAVLERLDEGFIYNENEMDITEYWSYIRTYRKHWQEDPLSRRSRAQINHKFMDTVNLFYDIKKRGMINPLDIIVSGGRCVLYAGARRLTILSVLGTEKAKIRYAIERTTPL